MKTFLIVGVIFCLLPLCVSAEIYKYVDGDGKVHFTDHPPRGVAAQTMEVKPNVISSGAKQPAKPAGEPSSAELRKQRLLEATHPKVELFVTSWCGYCKRAEAYLRQRGIPFTAYDIEQDSQAALRMQQLTNSRGVPFALIGDRKLSGFSEAAYDEALRAAR